MPGSRSQQPLRARLSAEPELMSRAQLSAEPELASRVRSWAQGQLSAMAWTLGCWPPQLRTWLLPSELLGERKAQGRLSARLSGRWWASLYPELPQPRGPGAQSLEAFQSQW